MGYINLPFFILWLLIFIAPFSYADNRSIPALTLAKSYEGKVDLTHYWVSEKLDGVRAYWDGQALISKQGHPFPAPHWFTKDFPSQPLDGELWLARSQFQQLLSIVSKKRAIDREWQQVKYYVFDLPQNKKSFSMRLKRLKEAVDKTDSLYLTTAHQFRVADKAELQQALKNVVAKGGEGLMLHRDDAVYRAGRNRDVLKVKPYYDAEATVISYIAGKGKFSGMLGSIVVEMPEGLQFRIGTGFTNKQRRVPPPIGSLVTYKYHGKTDKGIPKFASFLRMRANN
jgi:DNA ligase-1